MKKHQKPHQVTQQRDFSSIFSHLASRLGMLTNLALEQKRWEHAHRERLTQIPTFVVPEILRGFHGKKFACISGS